MSREAPGAGDVAEEPTVGAAGADGAALVVPFPLLAA